MHCPTKILIANADHPIFFINKDCSSRLLWLAGRYPYILGEQAELTTYRLLDQPEGRQLTETMQAVHQLSATFEKRLATLQDELETQLTPLLESI